MDKELEDFLNECIKAWKMKLYSVPSGTGSKKRKEWLEKMLNTAIKLLSWLS